MLFARHFLIVATFETSQLQSCNHDASVSDCEMTAYPCFWRNVTTKGKI